MFDIHCKNLVKKLISYEIINFIIIIKQTYSQQFYCMHSYINREQLANQKLHNVLNNSTSKMQYSFGKSKRFSTHERAVYSNASWYNLPSQKSKRSASIGYGSRYPLCRKSDAPSPDKYYTISSFHVKEKATTFKFGRDQVVFGKLIPKNSNPGPGQYNPEQSFSKVSFSFGKRLTQKQQQDSSPGPIYNLESTLLDEKKILSKHIRKQSVRFVLPSNHSRKQKLKTEPDSSLTSQFKIITRLGGHRLGLKPRNIVIPFQKRFKYQQKTQNVPGPGYYKSFSEFVQFPED